MEVTGTDPVKMLVEKLLGEIRYLHETGDIYDSMRNSAELKDEAARFLGYKSLADYEAAVAGD